MIRWHLPALLATPALVLTLGATPAAASIQCNISIVMTTLGTDGASTTTTEIVTSPSGTTVTSNGQVMTPPALPATPASSPTGATGNTNPGTTSTPSTDETPDTPAPVTPPATENPDESGPVAPEPPVLNPTDPVQTVDPTVEVPTLPTDPTVDVPTIPVPTSDPDTENTGGSVYETPEPGTLTLMALGLAGSYGYYRRKKAS